ncbi:MAG: acyl-CoA dehydrogenase family protein, partial [bacterium]
MDILLTKENLEYREKTRAIAEKYLKPIAAECDRDCIYPQTVMDELKKAGLSGVWVPKEYDGAGAGLMNLCIVVEELSRIDGGTGVAFALNALGSFPIILGGTKEQKDKYLPPIARGDKKIAYALFEKEAGSDAGSLKTRAVKDGDSYVINGDKKWTTGAAVSDLFTVFASTDPTNGVRGISAFVVEKGTPGFTVGKFEDKMGIRCMPVNETHFKECRVGASQLLGGQEGRGFVHAMQTLDAARPGVAAQALGIAQGAYELARDWSRERKQFGEPISQ